MPPPFALDLHEGRAWVGIVAFKIEGLRVRFSPVGMDFLETNVRTYITLNGEPAIWFVSLDAESTSAVFGARALYGLPYRRAEMRAAREGDELEYAHERTDEPRGSFRSRVALGAEIGNAAPGTREHFLVERYRFDVVRGRRVWSTEVRHAPYWLREAHVRSVEETLLVSHGLPAPSGTPIAHYSPGVDVDLLATRWIGRG